MFKIIDKENKIYTVAPPSCKVRDENNFGIFYY